MCAQQAPDEMTSWTKRDDEHRQDPVVAIADQECATSSCGAGRLYYEARLVCTSVETDFDGNVPLLCVIIYLSFVLTLCYFVEPRY